MAPSYYDSCDYGFNGKSVASNWQPSMLRDICNGGCGPSERSVRRAGPPFQAPACTAPCCATSPSSYVPPCWEPEPPVTCQLPPINRYASNSTLRRNCEDLPNEQDYEQDDCCPVPRRDVVSAQNKITNLNFKPLTKLMDIM